MAILESTVAKGLVALGTGVIGVQVVQGGGIPSISGSEEDSKERGRSTTVGGIPQRTGIGVSQVPRGRGYGVPQTVNRTDITKKNVTLEEGDTTIVRSTDVDNTSGGGGSDDDDYEYDSGLKKTGDDNDIIQDPDTGAVIRDATPDSGSSSSGSSGSGGSDDKTKKEDDSGSGFSQPIYSV